MTEQTCHLKVTYFAPSEKGYSPVNAQYFETPLRVSRLVPDSKAGTGLTYGHYFQAITQVISKAGFRPMLEAVSKRLGKEVSPAHIEAVHIFSEKHGSDYHPARIEVSLGDGVVSFVMNVAVTDRGKARLANEYQVLQHLKSKYDYTFLPHAYFQGEVFVSTGGLDEDKDTMQMFLADWLEGFHEFHLSIDKNDGEQKVVVWDGNKGQRYLSERQTRQVYQKVAKIMTLYYDLKTYEQIFPWHHGAGDFVAKTESDSVVVKLITARQYAPMIAPGNAVSAYDALLLFLLNLSLRTRLDRLDGVGDIVWAHDACVDATVEGFLEGLKIKEQQCVNETGLVDGFFQYTNCLEKEDLADMFNALVGACHPAAPDIPVIQNHLESHMATFYHVLQNQRPLKRGKNPLGR